MYIGWVAMLIVVGELAFGKMTDFVWEKANYGHTYATTDWSKFDQFEEAEDDK
jgi:hypothetical protein